MYEHETLSCREIKQMMQEIPNFPPRGYGVIVLSGRDYPDEYCGGIQKRITAGTATLREALTETMSGVRSPPFRQRLNQYIKGGETQTMCYRNEKHRQAFEQAIKRENHKNYALISVLYLLTADFYLWQSVKRCVKENAICFGQIRLNKTNEGSYTLYCAAKDLYLGTKYLTVSDLADSTIVPPKVFALVCNATAIRRFGLGALESMKGGDRQC